MNLSDFPQLLSQSPTLFGRLLRARGLYDSPEDRHRIVNFLERLTLKDVSYFREHAALQKKRALRLAHLTGLEPQHALSPLLLFEDYAKASRRDRENGVPPTEEEVRFWLTRARPIECCFLVGGQFCVWDKALQDFYIGLTSDGDPLCQQACAEYLHRSGSAFATMKEALEEVARRGLRSTDKRP